jgi:hypothetical protein
LENQEDGARIFKVWQSLYKQGTCSRYPAWNWKF